MISSSDRPSIIVADAGPLIRLAAAGLLGTLGGRNRRIVLVDRVLDEVTGDRSKPYAHEIAVWIRSSGDAIEIAPTAIGIGVETLRGRDRTPDEEAVLKRSLRNSGELAIREFIDGWIPEHPGAAVIVYEDWKVASLFIEADYPVTLMTTRAFAELAARWGINPDTPVDLRLEPTPTKD